MLGFLLDKDIWRDTSLILITRFLLVLGGLLHLLVNSEVRRFKNMIRESALDLISVFLIVQFTHFQSFVCSMVALGLTNLRLCYEP